jgi:hypothetical protein
MAGGPWFHHSSSPGSLGQIAPANRDGSDAWKTRSGNNEARAQISLDVNWLRKQANGCTETGPTEKAAASRIPKIFGTPLIPRQADGDPTPRSLHGLRLQRRQQEVETCCAQEATGNKTFEACPIFWIIGHEHPLLACQRPRLRATGSTRPASLQSSD